MVFKSNSQRRAFFATRAGVRADRLPRIVKEKPKLSPEMKEFLAKKIRKNIREGKQPKQAIAISFSQARKKFKDSRLIPKSNPHLKLDKRTRNLLFLIFGTAAALSIIRQIRA